MKIIALEYLITLSQIYADILRKSADNSAIFCEKQKGVHVENDLVSRFNTLYS
jgi:hypothetical protein